MNTTLEGFQTIDLSKIALNTIEMQTIDGIYDEVLKVKSSDKNVILKLADGVYLVDRADFSFENVFYPLRSGVVIKMPVTFSDVVSAGYDVINRRIITISINDRCSVTNALGTLNTLPYGRLSDKPKINGVELSGNKTSADLDISGIRPTCYGLHASTSVEILTGETSAIASSVTGEFVAGLESVIENAVANDAVIFDIPFSLVDVDLNLNTDKRMQAFGSITAKSETAIVFALTGGLVWEEEVNDTNYRFHAEFYDSATVDLTDEDQPLTLGLSIWKETLT